MHNTNTNLNYLGENIRMFGLSSNRILSLVFLILAVIIDWLIKNDYLGSKLKFYYLRLINMSFLSIFLIFFSIIFFVLTLLNCFDIVLFNVIDEKYFNLEGNQWMADPSNSLPYGQETQGLSSASSSNNNSVNLNTTATVSSQVAKGTVNVNTPSFNLSLTKEGINNLAAAASSAGGATLGVKVAQQIPGNPAIKVGAGLATMAVVQAGTAIMSKVLNRSNQNSNNDTNKFLSESIPGFNPKLGVGEATEEVLNSLYPEFPLNLLVEMNQLVNLELVFLSILFNVFIVNTITQINYSKYIPNNKLGRILNFFISRYIIIWSKSKLFLIIVSLIGLFSCVILSKICFYFIFNTGS